MEASVVTFRERSFDRRKSCHGQDSINFVKKQLGQKYLLSGFAIHAFLSSPVYLYGISVDSTIDPVIRIWPPIIYQAIGQIAQWFLNLANNKNNTNLTSCRISIIIATLITCLSVSIGGYLFSSAWTTLTREILAAIFYGIIGGIGSTCIYHWINSILEKVRPKEDKYVKETIQLCGQAFCQLFLSFVFTTLNSLYGSADALIILGALILNVVPVSLLVSSARAIPKTNPLRTQSIQNDEKQEQSMEYSKSFPTDKKILDDIDFPNKGWKSPNDVQYSMVNSCPEDLFVTYINANGVEIMEIIPEEDEGISDPFTCSSIIDFNDKINTKELSVHKIDVVRTNSWRNPDQLQKYIKRRCGHILDKFMIKVFQPFKEAAVILKIYPATLLQSCDIFSYVLLLTVLPSSAVQDFNVKFAEIPFLFSLLAFPWMCFALMTPKFWQTLVKKQIKWHILGSISKGLGLIMISISNSKLLLSVAIVFLGFGQAVSLFLQDIIVKTAFSLSNWNHVKYPIHAINGILIIFWGVLAHLLIVKNGFEAGMIFVTYLYVISVFIWYIIMIIKFLFKI